MLAHLRIGTGEDETEGFDGVELRQEAEAADVSGDTYPEHRQAQRQDADADEVGLPIQQQIWVNVVPIA